jgi:hypothetical protein
MTTRVTLLVLLTALFAAAWSGDGRDKPARSAVRTVGRVSAPSHNRPATEPISVELAESKVTAVSVARDLRLPTGIAPGTYRVVSNTGAVRRVELTAEELAGLGRAVGAAEELYVVSDAGSRWYFVRLDCGPSQLADAAPQSAEVAARQALRKIGRDLWAWSSRIREDIATRRTVAFSPRAVVQSWTERLGLTERTASRPEPDHR